MRVRGFVCVCACVCVCVRARGRQTYPVPVFRLEDLFARIPWADPAGLPPPAGRFRFVEHVKIDAQARRRPPPCRGCRV